MSPFLIPMMTDSFAGMLNRESCFKHTYIQLDFFPPWIRLFCYIQTFFFFFLFLKLYKSCTGFCLVYLSVMNPLDIALVIVHWTIASLLLRN